MFPRFVKMPSPQLLPGRTNKAIPIRMVGEDFFRKDIVLTPQAPLTFL
jgi:hypothetical protein